MQVRSKAAAVRRVALFSSCALPLVAAGCSAAPSNSTPSTPVVAVAKVQRGSISHMLSLAGQFQPYQVVQVHAKVSGYLRRINVDIGDRVHAGEVLGVLQVPELNAQYHASQFEAERANDAITAAKHEVARAKANHTAVQANFDRLSQAAKNEPGLIAAQELDDARSRADATAAQVDAAEAALAGAQQGAASAKADQERVGALQAYTDVTAPLTGVVTWRFADTGALIQAGTSSDQSTLPLVTLAQSDLLRLRVPVPEDAVRYVHVGDPMTIYVSALDRNFTGKVVRFTRDVSLSTRTMETEVDLPNPDLTVTPGMYANTSLRLAHVENALTVPAMAVTGGGQSGTVMVVGADGRLATRTVQVGLRGSTLVQVTAGLQEGDEVVLGDTSRYRDGELVHTRLQQEPASDNMHEEGGEDDPFAAQKTEAGK
jgi:RND family efflux transporter MFP subunit